MEPETFFKNYRDSIILKNTLKSKHVNVGDYTYYSGYYHGKSFDECILYLDELDNNVHEDSIDCLLIGKFCSIATGVKFMMCGTQGHNYNWITTHPLLEFDCSFPGHQWKGNTVVGNDVWFGAESLIMPGIQIADGAVIGARSVVTKNIGPYEIWAGNPARFVKKRFSDECIQKLLRIQWWNFTEEEIQKYLPILRSANVDELYEIALKKNS